jgi:hypothetical protein
MMWGLTAATPFLCCSNKYTLVLHVSRGCYHSAHVIASLLLLLRLILCCTLQAHALVARMSAGGASQLPFPFLCLLVSGGHNLLVLVKGVGQYMQLGTTLDDALGRVCTKQQILGPQPACAFGPGCRMQLGAPLHDALSGLLWRTVCCSAVQFDTSGF